MTRTERDNAYNTAQRVGDAELKRVNALRVNRTISLSDWYLGRCAAYDYIRAERAKITAKFFSAQSCPQPLT